MVKHFFLSLDIQIRRKVVDPTFICFNREKEREIVISDCFVLNVKVLRKQVKVVKGEMHFTGDVKNIIIGRNDPTFVCFNLVLQKETENR